MTKRSKELLEQVIADYSQTTAATEANQKLSVLKSHEQAEEANEQATVSILRLINTANVTYLIGTGKGRYSGSILELITADLLPLNYLAVTARYGIALSANQNGTDYEVTAGPVGLTHRYFFTNADAKIHYEDGRPATANSPELR